MATSFIIKKQRIYAEARKKDAKPALKKLAAALKNFGKLESADKADLKELVDAVYSNLVVKPTPTKKGETAKPTKKPSRSISQILKDFKAKIGIEKWKEATRGTDIYRDMERPALKKGKRIVSKRGKTSNQYGTFKNKVGTTYYENRANRFDVSKKYPKLADGGEFGGGGEIDALKKTLNQLESKRANWMSVSESRVAKKSPYDDNIYEIEQAIEKAKDKSSDFYEFPQDKIAREYGKSYMEKIANYFANKFTQPISYSKFLNSLKTPMQKEAFRRLLLKTYQSKWKVKPIINKTQNTIKFRQEFADGGEFGGGGRTGKKRIKRKKITRQNENYDKKADSGLVAKPQGHRFTDKLAKRLGKPSYAKPTQEQIEKYRGKGVYSENRQDKSDVNPKRTYPSL